MTERIHSAPVDATRASTERILSLQEALSLAHAECRALGLTTEVHEIGHQASQAIRVAARDRGGRIVEGMGKGSGDQCLASALFETIEHYWLQYGLHLPGAAARDVRALPIESIMAQGALAADQVLSRLAKEFPGARFLCIPFEPFGRNEAAIWYPLFLKNPFAGSLTDPPDDSDIFSGYFRYSSSTGVASGATEKDAELHALLETVERDAVSMALLDWFVEPSRAARTVARESLPEDLVALSDSATAVLGTPPALLDITTDLGISAFMAIPSQDNGSCGLFGAGASLDPAYAAERALRELIQVHFVNAEAPEPVERHRLYVAQLERWPMLYRCAKLAPSDVLRTSEIVSLPQPSEQERGDVARQIETVLSRLALRGFTAWKHRCNPGVRGENNPDTARVVVTSVLVPGLESFFLAASAQAVLPTGRGWARLHALAGG